MRKMIGLTIRKSFIIDDLFGRKAITYEAQKTGEK